VYGIVTNGEADGRSAVALRAELFVEPQALQSSATEPSTTSHCVVFMFLCMKRQAGQIVTRD